MPLAPSHIHRHFNNYKFLLSFIDNLSFSMHDFQYVTNQSMHRFKYVTNYQLEKDVGCKVLHFINTMKIMKLVGYKTQWRTKTVITSTER